LEASPTLNQAIIELLGAVEPPWLNTVRLLGVTPPEPHIAAGDPITQPLPGTAGCNVRWGGKVGFLTAGHVVGKAGVSVVAPGGFVGTSVYACDPTNRGTLVLDDVAVVELSTGPLLMAFAGSGHGSPNAAVSVLMAGGMLTGANLRGFLRWQFSPALNGTWGDLYTTMTAVTQPGHSGAPVRDGAGAVIGHVVGAMPNFGTLIQDVHYQLAAIANLPALAGIRI
jgi:hypothetical protein